MKRFVFLSVIAIFLCSGASGQWYQKYYGVASLNDLTKSQLVEALKFENDRIGSSLFMSVAGLFITPVGLYLFSTLEDANSGVFAVIGAISLTPLGIALAAKGITTLIVHVSHGNQVKEALSSPYLKFGLLKMSDEIISGNPTDSTNLRHYPNLLFLTLHFTGSGQ